MAPRFFPTSARLCVAALLVEYAMARNVKMAPSTTVVVLVPSTVPGTDGAQVAPGAEAVGQAQIVESFAPAFTLDGLFGAADAGAFGVAGAVGGGEGEGGGIGPVVSSGADANRHRLANADSVH